MTEAFLMFFQIFNYMGTILFIQYAVGNSAKADWHKEGRHEALYWLTIEVLSLYLYIMSAMVFLLRIQIKGLRGQTLPEHKKDRFKYDAIEYYKQEMDWFAFNFIFFSLDVMTLVLIQTGALYNITAQAKEEQDQAAAQDAQQNLNIMSNQD